MTPDRIAAVRAEFERLNGPKPDNEIADTLEEHFEKKFLRRAWESKFEGFFLAHTSSEMAKDAERFVAWFDYGDAEVCDRVQYAMMNRADDDVAAWREEIDNATAAIKEQTK